MSWLKTPIGALAGGLLTIAVTVAAAYLTTAGSNAAQIGLDQASSGPWLRSGVLPVDSSQIGYVYSADHGTPTADGIDRAADMDAGQTVFKIQLTGLLHSGVRIYDGHIRVHRRTDPRPGALYLPLPPQGGDKTIGLTADLDAARPGLHDAEDKGELYFERHDVTLGFGEHVTITMHATAAHTAVDWDVELNLQRDGDDAKSTIVLDNGGRPWVTTAVQPGLRGYTVIYDQQQFGSWQRHTDVAQYCRTSEYCKGGR